MKTSVLGRRGGQASILSLEPSVQKGIGDLGMTAAALLAQQDPSLWAQASDTDFLNKLVKGAMFLMQIGREKGPDVAVKDSVSHHAFMTCMFLASQAGQLGLDQKANLRVTLLLLAECCPVDLSVPAIPPLEELTRGLRQQSIMQKHYPELALAKSHYTFTLADARRLLSTMERAPSVPLIALMAGLRQLTDVLRTSLRQTEPPDHNSGDYDAMIAPTQA